MAAESVREFRSIDGSGNNLDQPAQGSAGTEFLRKAGAHYADGVSAPAGTVRPGAREVSNAVFAQSAPQPNSEGASDFLWLWGQFLDHDITLTKEAETAEPFDIAIPKGDPHFDPFATGTAVMPFVRSGFALESGTGPGNPREQVNEITAYIDASMVYGSDSSRAAFLRGEGGKLKLSVEEYLPFHDGTLPDAPKNGSMAFAAGDVRANENVALTSMHTLFAREHNRLVDELAGDHPDWDAERLYQEAKALVEAEIQAITYNEFLPLLLGADALPDYAGYRSEVDPGISNLFATAAYRVGHTMLGSTLWRVEESGEETGPGNLALRDAFFRPDRILNEGGIDPVLRGVALGQAQAIDSSLVDDVRNFLFGPPGSGGLDLAALNVQRGRDHGLASYNEAREAYGLARITDFAQITQDRELQGILRDLYGSVEEIDVWVGGLTEDPMPGAMVGELFQAVLVDQFVRLRDGDRFWYQNRFSGEALEEIEASSLAAIIKLNSGIDYLQDNVFLAYDRIGGSEGADRLTGDAGRDLIIGFEGDDHLRGRGGDDQLHGGEGRDRLVGGSGRDKLDGEAGDDQLRGGRGDDWLLGGLGEDELRGQSGADRLDGGGGADLLIGGGGADRLDGGAAHDELFGGGGTDLLEGGSGSDYLEGGRNHDDLSGDSGDDLLLGGPGDDRLDGGAGSDALLGGDGDDELSGGTGRDELFGEAGDDRLDGGGGGDDLWGGQGRDQLHQSGADLLDGGDGDDSLEIRDLDFRAISGGAGFDSMIVDLDDQIDLDLTRLENWRVSDIQLVDLERAGDDSLILSVQDLIDLTGTDNRLLVDGDAGDRVVSTGQGWTESGQAQIGGVTYNQYSHTSSAALLVDQDMASSDVS